MPWIDYYQHHEHSPPSDTINKGLTAFGKVSGNQMALDLGCGNGRDSLALLQAGFQVWAIDGEPKAVEWVKQRLFPDWAGQLAVAELGFEEVREMPASSFINAHFSIPFCHPDHFDSLWQAIVGSLAEGGIFAGTLFGDRDQWLNEKDITFHTLAQAKARFVHFDLIHFAEEEKLGKVVSGAAKQWHIFHIVARKK